MKKKLSLRALKVQSFITQVESPAGILGGAQTKDGACEVINTVKNDCVSNLLHSACQTCGIVCHDTY